MIGTLGIVTVNHSGAWLALQHIKLFDYWLDWAVKYTGTCLSDAAHFVECIEVYGGPEDSFFI